MTRCAYTETRLRGLLDGELDASEQARVLAHLDACGLCSDAFARMQAVSALLQQVEPEEVPDHFSASLQVRLARHRAERSSARKRSSWLQASWNTLPRFRLAGGLASVAVIGVISAMLLGRGIGATEVAQRAELSWGQIRNYGCKFVSQGVYQGQVRTFTQRQFFRKPGDFRLDTEQDYQLTTYVTRDKIIHYLPGGEWDKSGPLCIVRPRTEAHGALPFPFGASWQTGGNVSLDELIRQLNENDDATLLGTEKVGEQDCYHLQFTAVPAGGSKRDRYDLWVDKQNFIPRRVSWYRDEQNQIITEARDLQVNYDVLPAGTFDFQIPKGARVIHGDVDPHVLAMPFIPERPELFDTQPTVSANEEGWRRAGSVPFRVVMPDYLPDGFRLVRVRRKSGRWLDAHWIRKSGETDQIVKLVEQDARLENWKPPVGAVELNVGTQRSPQTAWMASGTVPYEYAYVTWQRGDNRCTLFAAGLSQAEVERIVRSMGEVTSPTRPVSSARTAHRSIRSRGEPSTLPTELEGQEVVEIRSAPEAPAVEPPSDQPPMMPEMSDEDRGMGTPMTTHSREGSSTAPAAGTR